jgi:glycerate 2-kinase
MRRADTGHEYRAQAPFRDTGRAARGCLASADHVARDFGRDGRRPYAHCVRTVCAGPDNLPGSAGGIEALRSQGAKAGAPETPKPRDRIFKRVENRIIATAQQSLQAAAKFFITHDIHPAILGDTVTGEARDVARVYAALAREVKDHGLPWGPPVALISGGETTVTVRGKGRGGRNSEFLLALAVSLDGAGGIHALACDTDGIDGSEDNAGAILEPDTLKRAVRKKLDPESLLDENDGYGFFSALDDLIVTGPTRTNVNDYRVILVL